MSILPLIFDHMYLPGPSRPLDQHFGMELDEADLLTPFTIPQDMRRLIRIPSFTYYQPWTSNDVQMNVLSQISQDKDKFQVNLDVQHFRPEEITVKITEDNMITIEGKQEEKEDEHGYISRQFVRKYHLPKGHDVQNIQSKLSSAGVLTITAPKVGTVSTKDRIIPIQQTGVPSQLIENKLEDKKDEK
ncbi:hypothetical protein Trydic_g3522 [Trypoxylus dichotomus]